MRNTMRKHHIDYFARRLLPAFLTSVCQYILFIPVFVICLFFIPWPPIQWILIVSQILIPILSAYGCCFLVHRNNFHFDSRNIVSKASAYRLTARLLSVFCFLLIGYTVSRKQRLPMFVFDLLDIFGEYTGTFASLLTNFFAYITVAIFPTVFALVEYLFVAIKSNYSTDS